MMKEKISRVCLTVYAMVFLLSGFVGTPPGGHLTITIILMVFALPPILIGRRIYRVLGLLALALALVGITLEFRDGQTHQKALAEHHQVLLKK